MQYKHITSVRGFEPVKKNTHIKQPKSQTKSRGLALIFQEK